MKFNPINGERVCKALANRRRLIFISYLKRHGQRTVGELAAHAKLSMSATSRHLSLLTQAGFLENEQRNLQVYYRVARPTEQWLRALISIC